MIQRGKKMRTPYHSATGIRPRRTLVLGPERCLYVPSWRPLCLIPRSIRFQKAKIMGIWICLSRLLSPPHRSTNGLARQPNEKGTQGFTQKPIRVVFKRSAAGFRPAGARVVVFKKATPEQSCLSLCLAFRSLALRHDCSQES